MGLSVVIAGPAQDEMKGLTKGLQAYHNEVFAAHDGEEALKVILTTKKLGAVILYASLPGVDALHLCEQLRKMSRFRRIPIVILADTPVQKQAFLALKVNAILARPFSSPDLHQLLRSLSAAQTAVSGPGLSLGQQVTGVTITISLFIAFVSYFILIPMFAGAKLKTPPAKGKAVMSRITDY